MGWRDRFVSNHQLIPWIGTLWLIKKRLIWYDLNFDGDNFSVPRNVVGLIKKWKLHIGQIINIRQLWFKICKCTSIHSLFILNMYWHDRFVVNFTHWLVKNEHIFCSTSLLINEVSEARQATDTNVYKIGLSAVSFEVIFS